MAALTDSVRKAQIPSLCHLCEDSSNIQWKCVDCDLLMCSKCTTKVHSKFKAAEDHDVISLKDVTPGSEQKNKPNLQNITCKIHKEQKLCLFCYTCDTMACPNCVTDNHKKHDFEELRKVYDQRLRKLEYFYDEMKTALHCSVDEELAISNELSKCDNINVMTKQNILRQEEELIKVIRSEATTTLDAFDSLRKQQISSILSVKANALRNQEEIKSNILALEEILNGNDIETIMHADKNIIPLFMDSMKPNLDKPKTCLKFEPEIIDKEQVSKMFGRLQLIRDEPEVKMEVLVSQKTDYRVITNLISCKNGNIMIFDEKRANKTKTLQFKDNKINALSERTDIRVFDITETEGNEFVVSFVDNSTLKRLRLNGKFDDFLDLSPLLPRALHSRSEKLFVGVREQGNVFPLQSMSQRKILVMKDNGKIIHEYNFDNKCERLFSYVARITSGMNSDIYLIDRTSDNADGSVAALGYPNKIHWRYRGNDSINKDISFRPVCIVVTESGSIVVNDKDSKCFHILNCEGSLKNFIDTNEYSMFPYMLDIDAKGFLWIGCTTKAKSNSANAMLHVAKITGF